MTLEEAHNIQRRELISLRAENKRLQKKISELNPDAEREAALSAENKKLRKQLDNLFPSKKQESLERHIRYLNQQMSSELLFDIVADKVLGNVPVIGIYFNAICAKTMTWRLGIAFTMLSARGDEINPTSVKNVTKLIRLVFPQNDAFTFKQPSYETFEKLVLSVEENTQAQFENKIIKALEVFDE